MNKNSKIRLDKKEKEIFENLTKIIEKYKIEKKEIKSIVRKTTLLDLAIPLNQSLNVLEWDSTHWSEQISIYDSK